MVYEGTEAKFTCTATTDPEEVQNLKIEWKKDGQIIDYTLAQRFALFQSYDNWNITSFSITKYNNLLLLFIISLFLNP